MVDAGIDVRLEACAEIPLAFPLSDIHLGLDLAQRIDRTPATLVRLFDALPGDVEPLAKARLHACAPGLIC